MLSWRWWWSSSPSRASCPTSTEKGVNRPPISSSIASASQTPRQANRAIQTCQSPSCVHELIQLVPTSSSGRRAGTPVTTLLLLNTPHAPTHPRTHTPTHATPTLSFSALLGRTDARGCVTRHDSSKIDCQSITKEDDKSKQPMTEEEIVPTMTL